MVGTARGRTAPHDLAVRSGGQLEVGASFNVIRSQAGSIKLHQPGGKIVDSVARNHRPRPPASRRALKRWRRSNRRVPAPNGPTSPCEDRAVDDPYAEGFRTPALCRRAGFYAGPASESLVRRKPRAGMGAVSSGATYGDFGVADGALVGFRGLVARIVLGGNEGDELCRSRAYERRVWARRAERVCGRFEDSAFLLRGAVGGEEKRRWAVGSPAIVMRCRS